MLTADALDRLADLYAGHDGPFDADHDGPFELAPVAHGDDPGSPGPLWLCSSYYIGQVVDEEIAGQVVELLNALPFLIDQARDALDWSEHWGEGCPHKDPDGTCGRPGGTSAECTLWACDLPKPWEREQGDG